ncbi:MAG: hypothetical protein J6Q92_00505 [Oscillospiraceae bacterium]|nr:hypothetical protein [Oscillospiraceae bacterium]
MVDIHTHILPQMDDGSSGVEETMQMLQQLHQQGVKTVVATPHFYPRKDNPKAFLARREAAVALLPEMDENFPEIVLGAEVGYFTGMSRSEELEKLQLGQTGLLLIEMPFDNWTDRIVQEVCDVSARRGLQPVIAHINRYRHRGQLGKYGQILLREGVLFQCNADAFDKFFSCSWTTKALKKGQIHFLGSDCHNCTTRPPKIAVAKKKILQVAGAAALEQIARTEAEYFK